MGTHPSNLVELLQGKVAQHPDAPLFTFLLDGEFQEISVSFADLDRKARQIAVYLRQRGLAGERVALLYAPGLDYISGFMGCLYAGVIAVPAYPPDPIRLQRSLPRLTGIVEDCQARAILTTEDIRVMGKMLEEQAPPLARLEWIATDVLTDDPDAWRDPGLTPGTLAFLQYTSGSTGQPKGVMLSHSNLLNNLAVIHEGFELGKLDGRSMFWLPPYHDMGLIGGILGTLSKGAHGILMSPLAFLQKPVRWLQAISRFQAQVSGAPNFAYELCLKKVTPAQRDALDLSHWTLAFSGAEPVRADTLDRFAEYFAPCGFKKESLYPCYGLAEATLMVTGSRRGVGAVCKNFQNAPLQKGLGVEAASGDLSSHLASSGVRFQGLTTLIVDPHSHSVVPDGKVGEIWVKGPSVAQGYWQKDAENEKVFRARTADGQGPFLRTGDLGFFHESELFVTGRCKDLIIIRGANHYPQDIELTVEREHPLLRAGGGAVFTVDSRGEEKLVVVHEVDLPANPEQNDPFPDIFSRVRRAVADRHDLQVEDIVFIRKGTLPKTSSGKVRRQACREELLAEQLEVVARYRAEQASAAKVEEIATVHFISTGEIETWLRERLAVALKIAPTQIDPKLPFSNYGLDSKETVLLSGDLEEKLGRSLSPTLLWQYPNLEKLLQFLESDGEPAAEDISQPARIDSAEPIAIIGLACRFPGAPDAQAYWRLLHEGGDAVSEVPASRWDLQEFYDPNPAVPGKMNTRWGAFLDQVDGFDAEFFNISPREAARMDPQQRLLLEVSWHALEDAGLAPNRLAGSATGVFVGISGNDYSKFLGFNPQNFDAYTGTGNAHSIAANRLSYFLDARGPSMAVDTACSSSLVALHLACESLRRGDSHLALAGGVNLLLAPELTVTFSQARMMSSTGRCKTFDAAADGYVRGEGCGVVVLKRFSDAVKDGDRILAVVRGTAVNQDGRSNGLTAPNGQAQQQVIRQALQRGGIKPAEISYVEAHGTGTPLGDPIEMEALGKVLSEGRNPDSKCWVGSVKTNIGHLEAAAGIAGLIKIVLSLQHRSIPAHLHLQRVNPHIQLQSLPLSIPSVATPWEGQGDPRRAGVSSFGFGGTNAHAVLEEAPAALVSEKLQDRPVHVLKISGRTSEALHGFAAELRRSLQERPEIAVQDFAFSANLGRGDFEHRHCLRFETREDLLRQWESLPSTTSPVGPRPKVAFLFTGQGSQYAEMAKELYESQDSFRAILEASQEILRTKLEKPLLDVLFNKGDAGALLDETAYTQPALYTLAWALTELWREWGVQPDFAMGHSIGEYAAAAVAGVFSWEEGLSLIAERAALMQSLPKTGSMLAVVAEESQAREWIAPYERELSIAAINGPRSIVLSGDRKRLQELGETLRTKGVVVQELQVSHAFHSPLMDPILEAFEKKAAQLGFRAPRIPLVSNLHGSVFAPGQAPDAKYFARHLRQTVLFQEGMRQLLKNGAQIFLEIGPQPTLLALGKRCISSDTALWLPSLKRGAGDWRVLSGSLAELYRRGTAIDWQGWDLGRSRHKVSVPQYPFQRQRHWLDFKDVASPRVQARLHPMIDEKFSGAQDIQYYRAEWDLKRLAFLQDHRIGGECLLPAAAFLELAVAAARDAFPGEELHFRDFKIDQALFLDKSAPQEMQIVLEKSNADQAEIKIFSRRKNSKEAWTFHAAGRFGPGRFPLLEAVSPSALQGRMEERSVADFYRLLQANGLDYGPAFQGVEKLWAGKGEAFARVTLPETATESGYHLHPALLDAAFQSLAAAFRPEEAGTFVPVGFKSMTFSSALPATLYAWVRLEDAATGNEREADLLLFDEAGKPILEMRGLSLKDLGKQTQRGHVGEKWSYSLQWKEKENAGNSVSETGAWLLWGEGHLAERLRSALLAKGESVIWAAPGKKFTALEAGRFLIDPKNSEDWEMLAKSLSSEEKKIKGWLHCEWETAEDRDEPHLVSRRSMASLFHGVQSFYRSFGQGPPLWIVTQGALFPEKNDDEMALEPALLWGMGRSLAWENSSQALRLVDLSSAPNFEEIEGLVKELLTPDAENQISFQAGKRRVGRLARGLFGGDAKGESSEPQTVKPGEGFRLEILDSGTLEGAAFRRCSRRALQEGEIEIEVASAGLNFSDVLKVLGLYPGLKDSPVPLGAECSGRIVAVGTGVSNFKPGDEVMAIAPFSFGRYAATRACLAVSKPGSLSFAQAATVPVAFLTAYYALIHLAGLKKGEKVLIHAAAGGVGQAALQIAKQIGAEVFGTAGSEEKREFLRAQGVDHVMDSRSLDFADEILRITQGRGVDVVLNSLAGEFISKSLSILAAYGRFLEIGKIDIYQNSRVGLEPFQKSLSYFAIDLDRMFRDRQDLIQSLFAEIAAKFEAGIYQALPSTEFGNGEVAGAFRYMAQRKNIGKVVVNLDGSPVQAVKPSRPVFQIKAKGRYLVTGAAGALGLQVVQNLVAQGARSLVLLGRSEPQGKAAEAIAEWRRLGLEVDWHCVDVSDFSALRDIFEGRGLNQNLSGIFHCAGVLSDGLLLQQSWENFEKVFPAKVDGALHLHRLTQALDLDCFVLFSSIAGVLGSPGQANYAAANAFLDALARERHRRGLAALSVDWGPWQGDGMAGSAEAQKNLHKRGLHPFTPSAAIRMLNQLLSQGATQALALDVDWNLLLAPFGEKSTPPLFEELISTGAFAEREIGHSKVNEKLREKLALLDPDGRQQTLQSHMQVQVARVLGIDPARLDPTQPLNALGLDSLMAIELKNEIEGGLRVAIPIATLLKGPSLAELASQLAPQFAVPEGGN